MTHGAGSNRSDLHNSTSRRDGDKSPTRSYKSDQKSRQAAKIAELANAIEQAGLLRLDEQAKALGLERSTAWTILQGNHKASGISAKIINRMLTSIHLPQNVRAVLIEYIEEKAAGIYGHGNKECKKFVEKLSGLPFKRKLALTAPQTPQEAAARMASRRSSRLRSNLRR
jgi:hypothetical protein